MRKHYGLRLGAAVLTAMALAGTGATAAHAADEPGADHHSGKAIFVRGDHNQVVMGNENVTGRDNVSSSGHSDTTGVGEGDQAAAPAQPFGTVISPTGVVLRAAPTSASAELGTLAHNAQVGLDCKVHGQNVDGNDLWYRVRGQAAWVTARYVVNTGTVPFCPTDEGGGNGRPGGTAAPVRDASAPLG